MDQQRIIEVLWNIGQFFVHPVFYLAIAAAIATGYFRVKKERKDFRTRLHYGWGEVSSIFKHSWLYSLIISCVLILIGVVIYPEFLVLLAAVALIALIVFQFQALSSAYLIPTAVGLWAVLHQLSYTIYLGPLTISATEFSVNTIWPLALLIGLLLIAEGLLVKKQGLDIVSPQLIRTERGGTAVQYKTKRVWLLPFLFLIPGDWFGEFNSIWPLIHFGETSFALVAFPFITGFQQLSKKEYPFITVPRRAREFILLGSTIAAVSLLGIVVPVIGVIAMVVAFAGRLYLDSANWRKQNTGHYAVAPISEGIQIAGVLSGSPAEKMGLRIGERIMKVNGQRVANEQELYEAIQINAAHCRLEVLDHNNELRLKQHVIFRHDHHRLGLMIARETL
ncbi:PDZ domain-containing protein [Chryseomicrobium sp. FSL W7-1435]|uniref:PDZ domain-containing protein n=1 Tax=Chryseomicrobium sp. FSL W7-1435 TaxID=2921704 RepID=UPI003159AD0A